MRQGASRASKTGVPVIEVRRFLVVGISVGGEAEHQKAANKGGRKTPKRYFTHQHPSCSLCDVRHKEPCKMQADFAFAERVLKPLTSLR